MAATGLNGIRIVLFFHNYGHFNVSYFFMNKKTTSCSDEMRIVHNTLHRKGSCHIAKTESGSILCDTMQTRAITMRCDQLNVYRTFARPRVTQTPTGLGHTIQSAFASQGNATYYEPAFACMCKRLSIQSIGYVRLESFAYPKFSKLPSDFS